MEKNILNANKMEIVFENLPCSTCKHLREVIGCDAFPVGIPFIKIAESGHSKPLPGQDNKIVYEKGIPNWKREFKVKR